MPNFDRVRSIVRGTSTIIPRSQARIAIALAVAIVIIAATAASAGPPTAIPLRMTRLGSIDLTELPPASTPAPRSTIVDEAATATSRAAAFAAVNRRIPRAARFDINSLTLKIPVATAIPLNLTKTGFFGFKGLDALTSENLDGGGLSGTIEPPDQGLCVGNGEVLELVNLAFSIYNTSGTRTFAPQSLADFFGVSPSDFLSDPKCIYDAATKTFFFSLTDLGGFPDSLTSSSLLLGVMPAGGTTATAYKIDTTDDGSNGILHPHCPCFEDQPLLGADNFGVYITGNEFQLARSGGAFNGSQIYAINKTDLVDNEMSPGVDFFESPILLAEGIASSIQPGFSPSAADFDTTHGGIEYFLAALDFNATLDNRISVWAITNTCGLPSTSGNQACLSIPTLSPPAVLSSDVYGVPPLARQKTGPHPLGSLLHHGLERLQTDDDRMQQVVLAGGKLYSALSTVAKVGAAKTAAALYFIVQPSITGGGDVAGTIVTQNYVAARGLYLSYPSIASTSDGRALMAFSLSGPSRFVSAGYFPVTSTVGLQNIFIAAAGVGVYDGISGYVAPNVGVARWGDYSAVVADGSELWMAAEYVSGACTVKQYRADNTCGGIRGVGANWGTFISQLTPASP